MQYTLTEILKIFPKTNFEWIKEIKEVTEKIKGEWMFVGGCVRDSLLGFTTYDIDICTFLHPEEVIQCMKGMNISVVGQKFGTIGVFYKNWQIEITTTRRDINTYGRHADVGFISSFEEDSERRDFTINALMFKQNVLHDFHNGINDLREKKIIFVGNAETRIEEDYLRIIRYIRFFARFGKGEISYFDVIQNKMPGLKNVSSERIISELEKMSKHINYNVGIKAMNHLKLSQFLFECDLFENNEEEAEKKFAYTFLNISKESLSKLPMKKTVKEIIECKFEITGNIEKDFCLIWQRKKNFEMAKEFLKFQRIFGKKIFTIPEKEFKPIDLSVFEGKERGIAELCLKYCYIKNEDLTIDNLKKYFSIWN